MNQYTYTNPNPKYTNTNPNLNMNISFILDKWCELLLKANKSKKKTYVVGFSSVRANIPLQNIYDKMSFESKKNVPKSNC